MHMFFSSSGCTGNIEKNIYIKRHCFIVKCLVADELSTVISDLWTNTDSRLGEIFMFIPENTFAGLSGMTVADLLQLLPVKGKYIFSQSSDKDMYNK